MKSARHLARWAPALVPAATGLGMPAAPARAHPNDETVQQVYLTPTASALSETERGFRYIRYRTLTGEEGGS